MIPCLLHYSEADAEFPEAVLDLSLTLDPVLLHPRGETTHPVQKMMTALHVDNLEWIARKADNLERKMKSATSMVVLELKEQKSLEALEGLVTQAIRNRHIYAIHRYTHVCYIHTYIYMYIPYLHVHICVNNQNLIINIIVC